CTCGLDYCAKGRTHARSVLNSVPRVEFPAFVLTATLAWNYARCGKIKSPRRCEGFAVTWIRPCRAAAASGRESLPSKNAHQQTMQQGDQCPYQIQQSEACR